MSRTRLIAIAGLALVSVWLTYPSKEIDISLKSCQPSGVLANLRSILHEDLFWNNQRQALSTKLAEERNWPKRKAELDRTLNKAIAEVDQTLEEMYRENPELKPAPPTQSERLYRMAEEAEQRELDAFVETFRQEEIHRLETCLLRIPSR